MDQLTVGSHVDIKRSDGRVHVAEICKLNIAEQTVDVRWIEDGVEKGIDGIGAEELMALNPQLRMDDSSEEEEQEEEAPKPDDGDDGGSEHSEEDEEEKGEQSVVSSNGGGGGSDDGEEETVVEERQLSNADIVKKRYEQLTLDERRENYQKPAVTLAEMPDLKTLVKENKVKPAPTSADRRDYAPSDKVNAKVSLFAGDITTLEVDAIVNAATEDLAGGGGGVNGAIHKAAGADLRVESVSLAPCKTGDAKITYGYRLPANYVIHTVGPMGRMSDDAVAVLERCYKKALEVAKNNNLKSIAFPRLGGRIPCKKATSVALRAVRAWLEVDDNADHVDRIIFCPYSPTDIEQYKEQLLTFFPQ